MTRLYEQWQYRWNNIGHFWEVIWLFVLIGYWKEICKERWKSIHSRKDTRWLILGLLRRLFTVLYFPVRSSTSSALRYGLPSCMSPRRPPPPYIWKSRWLPLTGRRAILSWRSHEKIGDCSQSISFTICTLVFLLLPGDSQAGKTKKGPLVNETVGEGGR